MPSEELKKFIDESHKAGLGNQQIKQNLLSAGWPESEINQALNPAPLPPAQSGPPIPQSPQPNQSQSGQINLSDNKLMAVLAYLGILIIIPFITAKNDPYVKFHIKQGIALIILWVIIWILSFVIGIFLAIIQFPLFGLISLLFPLLWLLSVILVIIGIMNAATGKQKELPVVGGWGNKFNF